MVEVGHDKDMVIDEVEVKAGGVGMAMDRV